MAPAGIFCSLQSGGWLYEVQFRIANFNPCILFLCFSMPLEEISDLARKVERGAGSPSRICQLVYHATSGSLLNQTFMHAVQSQPFIMAPKVRPSFRQSRAPLCSPRTLAKKSHSLMPRKSIKPQQKCMMVPGISRGVPFRSTRGRRACSPSSHNLC